jgi:integrase
MKMKREHKIPLPRQAVEILTELHCITGRGELLFPGLRSYTRPLSDGALGAALRTMGFAQDVHSPHGFRATAATLLNECGEFSVSGIEAALAHQDPDKVRAAYTRGAYWAERVAIAQWWADRCDEMRAAI